MSAEKQPYKYRREDFGELSIDLHHLTIRLNFIDERVEASNCLEMTARHDLDSIELDARDLTILRVEWCDEKDDAEGEGVALDFRYETERNRLVVTLPRRVRAGERFRVRTLTECVPSDHILEGIYKDATPPGAPQQYMSQCQQWGFQRIMPIFDDCRAKCTMTTTLEADARYTHLISNGNISRSSNPDGKPVLKPGDPTRQVITYENPIPMAPYLFLACAGTWDSLVDRVIYESGRSVRLEYLVPPGKVDGARIPMEILKESILWIARAQDYEYTGDTYRTICMNKSNFGGMENVGNTTIVTDAALIDEHTLDTSLLYAHAVIVHEFEHNQCGSETTMDTPFDVWLNEAYTVDVERQFMADIFDSSFVRLQQVESIRNPLLGPLAMEDGGHVGRIVREGFNDPDELIDGVTYVKAAEVIRMLRLVIGADHFKAGKRLYFSRYRHGNATTDQFFACFEEAAGCSLEQFKRQWLYTIGYPKVTATTHFDPAARKFRIGFRQDLAEGQSPFHLPLVLALVDEAGDDVPGTACVFQLKDAESELVLENVPRRPAFASMNRDYSFYGTFSQADATRETLALQTRLDPNPYNRVDAMRQLTDQQRVRLLLHPDAPIDADWLELYGNIIGDRSLPSALKAYFLRIDEQPMDRGYSVWYPELVVARDRLMRAVNERYRDQLLENFRELDTYKRGGSPKDGIEDRLLKQVLLDLIVMDDSPESHQLILDHLAAATTATDRVAALLALNRSASPRRHAVLEEVYGSWHTHLSGYANYLRVISSGTQDDVFAMIAREKERPSFDITQPTWCRALFLPMAVNTRKVWTDEGIRWIGDTVIALAPINATTTSRLLNTFQHVRKLKPELREKVIPTLERIVERVSPEVSPTIHGQASAYLRS
ncbi:M1 family metallopeptidase [Desulforhabdus sp. TSK]|uniref:M1 family metallopeptidase n=1 Tax=Desulforhabdus sp. TSK TaxID=2925014 RepID=UPI001FC82F41|nr:M1 family metallopeptidase [Desulforhabdus sp. TSK]GKT10706.1 peptidase [Desulforhabdus sp. TSK]